MAYQFLSLKRHEEGQWFAAMGWMTLGLDDGLIHVIHMAIRCAAIG